MFFKATKIELTALRKEKLRRQKKEPFPLSGKWFIKLKSMEVFFVGYFQTIIFL